MSVFTEGFWTIIILAAVVEAALAIALWRSGRGFWLAAMGVVLAGAAALVIVERSIVTDNEKIAAVLGGAAAALEANELDRLLAYFAPTVGPLRADVKRLMSEFRFQEVRIAGDLEITINRLTAPPQAAARFLGRLRITDPRGRLPFENYVDRVTVLLEQHQGQWLIAGYDTQSPRHP